MIPGRYALRILLIIIFYLSTFSAIAQPTLPDIAGSAGKGIVILSWVCQYNGIRSITVLHSMDSVKGYTEAGHIKKKDKGVQAFADGHPAIGKNFYKLAIVFNSGLTWSSNHCCVVVDKTSEIPLPENDSLQKFIVTQDLGKAAIADTIARSVTRNDRSAIKPDKIKQAVPDTSGLFVDEPKTKNKIDTAKKQAEPPHKILVSFEFDSSDLVSGAHPGSGQVAPQKKKITVNFEDPGENSITFIKSRFIFTDPATGHVNMQLPDDIKTHHYSVKFYDEHNHVVIDVPKISTANIIIDKRNFQQNGVYKFILRRDVTEFERGYIEIKPQ
jgi:hypothetical protein